MNDTESEVIADIKFRQAMGLNKYKTTVAENPLSLREWLQHALEECLDQAVYLKRAIQEFDEMMKPEPSEPVEQWRDATEADRSFEPQRLRVRDDGDSDWLYLDGQQLLVSGLGNGFGVFDSIGLVGWDQCQVLAKPKSVIKESLTTESDDWISWNGGKNPVPGKKVDVVYRNSNVTSWHSEAFCWESDGGDYDIIKYRVIK